jgi:NAD(P)H-flavin reductase
MAVSLAQDRRGGIRVHPFLSLAEDLANDPADRDVVLVAGVSHPDEAFFADRLAAYAERSGARCAS